MMFERQSAGNKIYCPSCTKVAQDCDAQRDELQRLIDSGGVPKD
jgi:predicted dithiol-disulfide oxidoreductase (DUF899 family)